MLVHHSKVRLVEVEASGPSSTPNAPPRGGRGQRLGGARADRPESVVSNTIVNPVDYAAAAQPKQTSGGVDYAEADGITKQVQDNVIVLGRLNKQLGVEQREVARLTEQVETLTAANAGMAAEMTVLKDRFELEIAAMQSQVAMLTVAVSRCGAVLTDDGGNKVDSLDGVDSTLRVFPTRHPPPAPPRPRLAMTLTPTPTMPLILVGLGRSQLAPLCGYPEGWHGLDDRLSNCTRVGSTLGSAVGSAVGVGGGVGGRARGWVRGGVGNRRRGGGGPRKTLLDCTGTVVRWGLAVSPSPRLPVSPSAGPCGLPT